jgi:hypothetical protein
MQSETPTCRPRQLSLELSAARLISRGDRVWPRASLHGLPLPRMPLAPSPVRSCFSTSTSKYSPALLLLRPSVMAGLALAPSFLLPDFQARTPDVDHTRSSCGNTSPPTLATPPSYASFDFDSGDDGWACRWPACTWTGRSYDELGDHLAFHTAQHSFLCDWPGCPEGFADQDTFVAHYRRHLLAEQPATGLATTVPPALVLDASAPRLTLSKQWDPTLTASSCPPGVHLASPPQTPTYADGSSGFVPYPHSEPSLPAAPSTPPDAHGQQHLYAHLPPSPVSPVSLHPHPSSSCEDVSEAGMRPLGDQHPSSPYYQHPAPIYRRPDASRPPPPHTDFFQALAMGRGSGPAWIVSSADKLHRCRKSRQICCVILWG